MKRLIFTFCLVLCIANAVNAVMRAYVSDCGRVFYYYSNLYNDFDNATDEEVEYSCAQGITASIETNVDCDREKVNSEVEEKFRNEVYKVYQSNCSYMSQNFNVHYTFDEIFNIVKDFRRRYGFIDNIEKKYYYDIYVLIYCDFLYHQDKIEKYNKEYPYWLGYLYKEVKYNENGKRLKEPTNIKYK